MAASPSPPHANRQRGNARRGVRVALFGAVVGLVCIAIVALGAAGARIADSALPLAMPTPAPSTVVLDADGRLLRAFPNAEGRWRLPVSLDDVDPDLIRLLIAYEDQRFRDHNGVDLRAIARAAWQAMRAGEVVSGASTLTMQVARLTTGQRRKSLGRKINEAWTAWRLDRRLGKDGILTAYLNAAPYGGNIEGVRAASLSWFGREPKRLTTAQIALLIALPQAPESRRPDRNAAAAQKARDRVLDRLAATGAIAVRDAREGKREPIAATRRPLPRLAPHHARRIVAAAPATKVHHTTFDAALQSDLENLAGRSVGKIGPKVSAAIVVVEHATGVVRAQVGSADFLSHRRAGHVDMTQALRSPGSALKPFIYALGIDAGLVAPQTLINDVAMTFGSYAPTNFDGTFRGPVSVAEALQHSLNIPAVQLLDGVGPVRLATRLKAAGVELALPEADVPALPMALGGLGITLSDLASLYTALASDGATRTLRAAPDLPRERHPLVSRRAAAAVADILLGVRPPETRSAGEIGYKTGTSYGHRDAVAVGFDAQHTVAVWIGRPDGTPVPTLTGWTDAAPLLFDVFARLGVHHRGARSAPRANGELPPPLKAYRPKSRTGAAETPIAIAFPKEGAVLELIGPAGARPLVAQVHGPPVEVWLLDGRPQPVRRHRRRAQLSVGPGHHTLTAITAAGEAARVSFSVR